MVSTLLNQGSASIVRLWTKLFVVALLICVPLTSQAANDNPYQVINVVAEKTFSRLNKEQSKIQKNPDYLRNVVQEELLPYVDVRYAGALVLGSYFRDANAAQKKAYFSAFEAYLTQAYGQALSMYKDQRYEISDEKALGALSIIPIRVTIIETGGRAPIRLDFQWRKNSKTGEWKAYDMSAEGISMITTKQNEWAAILRKGGVDELTKTLQEAASKKITLEAN